MEPERIAERVWPGRELVLEPLVGGITNQNFKVEVDGEVCVLRIGGKDSELLAIDRSVEHGASRVASELGIGPEVVGFVEPEGYLVTRVIDGRPIPPEEMRRPETIARAAAVLRRIHDGPPIPGSFDSFRVVEVYAAAHGVTGPDVFEWAHGVVLRIERRCARPPVALRGGRDVHLRDHGRHGYGAGVRPRDCEERAIERAHPRRWQGLRHYTRRSSGATRQAFHGAAGA